RADPRRAARSDSVEDAPVPAPDVRLAADPEGAREPREGDQPGAPRAGRSAAARGPLDRRGPAPLEPLRAGGGRSGATAGATGAGAPLPRNAARGAGAGGQ